jgi:hypothetical protein
MGMNVEHRQHKGLNNRAKNAHLPTLRRERIMKWIIKRFTSARHLKRLVFILDGVANLCNCPRHAMSSSGDRALRSGAIIVWREIAEPGIAAQRQGKSVREKLPVFTWPPFGNLTGPSLMAVSPRACNANATVAASAGVESRSARAVPGNNKTKARATNMRYGVHSPSI